MFDDDKELVSRCLKKERAAENQLYLRFASKMFGVCMRYSGDEMEAEEILQNGFLLLFSRLHQFQFKCPLEGWVRPIFVNTAINHYKKQLKFNQNVELTNIDEDATFQEDALSIMTVKELLAMIQLLPVGYRTIFNMHVIEGYGHKEIANLLGISEGTSKSQLHNAKISIRRMLKKMEN